MINCHIFNAFYARLNYILNSTSHYPNTRVPKTYNHSDPLKIGGIYKSNLTYRKCLKPYIILRIINIIYYSKYMIFYFSKNRRFITFILHSPPFLKISTGSF